MEFPTGHFMLPLLEAITDADIGSLKSLHTLFDKYLDHMLLKFVQNRKIKNVKNSEFFGKTCLTIFEKVSTPF